MFENSIFHKLQHLFNALFLVVGLNGGVLTFDANLNPTHVLDIQTINLVAELVKTMVGITLSITSALFYYIIYHKQINQWFKEVKWFKKKEK